MEERILVNSQLIMVSGFSLPHRQVGFARKRDRWFFSVYAMEGWL